MVKLLQVSNLSKSFGGVNALKRVSLELEEGQILAMIGPNGAGKSTCFNLINGQLHPGEGNIKIYGQEVVGLKPRQIWALGVGRTFQVTATFASMTVLENIQVALAAFHKKTGSPWRKLRNLFREEALELLHLVGIPDHSNLVCGLLSYGDLKRLELAVALTNQPRLLLMDEPTAGMEPSERRRLMDLTSQIVRNRNIGALFVEHDMDVVFAHADRIIVLDRGEKIAEGTCDQVRQNDTVREVYLGGEAQQPPG
jgi:branched-chain amino acid transport system ATP-binding protein